MTSLNIRKKHPLIEALRKGMAKGSVTIKLYGDVRGWTFWIHESFKFDDVTWSIGPFASREAAEADASAMGIEGYSVTDFRVAA
jgi:hypothetical protein